jgi:hypothetical protein
MNLEKIWKLNKVLVYPKNQFFLKIPRHIECRVLNIDENKN